MADFTYSIDKRLILVSVKLQGPSGIVNSDFVLDTGASYTIIDYRIAESIGYSVQDAVAKSRISSAVGKEEGYRVNISALEALG